MAKTRLLVKHREILKNFVLPRVSVPDADRLVREALEAANAAIVPLVDRQFPIADMRVLERYKLARVMNHVHVRWGDSYNNYQKSPLLTARLLPVDYHQMNMGDLRLPTNHAVYGLIDRWRDVLGARDVAHARKFRMYVDLIEAARNFEDLLEVWPEADLARPLLNLPAVNAIARVTPETVAFIRADCATRYPPKEEVSGE